MTKPVAVKNVKWIAPSQCVTYLEYYNCQFIYTVILNIALISFSADIDSSYKKTVTQKTVASTEGGITNGYKNYFQDILTNKLCIWLEGHTLI